MFAMKNRHGAMRMATCILCLTIVFSRCLITFADGDVLEGRCVDQDGLHFGPPLLGTFDDSGFLLETSRCFEFEPEPAIVYYTPLRFVVLYVVFVILTPCLALETNFFSANGPKVLSSVIHTCCYFINSVYNDYFGCYVCWLLRRVWVVEKKRVENISKKFGLCVQSNCVPGLTGFMKCFMCFSCDTFGFGVRWHLLSMFFGVYSFVYQLNYPSFNSCIFRWILVCVLCRFEFWYWTKFGRFHCLVYQLQSKSLMLSSVFGVPESTDLCFIEDILIWLVTVTNLMYAPMPENPTEEFKMARENFKFRGLMLAGFNLMKAGYNKDTSDAEQSSQLGKAIEILKPDILEFLEANGGSPFGVQSMKKPGWVGFSMAGSDFFDSGVDAPKIQLQSGIFSNGLSDLSK